MWNTDKQSPGRRLVLLACLIAVLKSTRADSLCYSCATPNPKSNCAMDPIDQKKVTCQGNVGCKVERISDARNGILSILQRGCNYEGRAGCHVSSIDVQTCTVMCSTDLCNDLPEAVVEDRASGGEAGPQDVKCYSCFSPDPKSDCATNPVNQAQTLCPKDTGCGVVRVSESGTGELTNLERRCHIKGRSGCYTSTIGVKSCTVNCLTTLCNNHHESIVDECASGGNCNNPAPAVRFALNLLIVVAGTTLKACL